MFRIEQGVLDTIASIPDGAALLSLAEKTKCYIEYGPHDNEYRTDAVFKIGIEHSPSQETPTVRSYGISLNTDKLGVPQKVGLLLHELYHLSQAVACPEAYQHSDPVTELINVRIKEGAAYAFQAKKLSEIYDPEHPHAIPNPFKRFIERTKDIVGAKSEHPRAAYPDFANQRGKERLIEKTKVLLGTKPDSTDQGRQDWNSIFWGFNKSPLSKFYDYDTLSNIAARPIDMPIAQPPRDLQALATTGVGPNASRYLGFASSDALREQVKKCIPPATLRHAETLGKTLTPPQPAPKMK